MIRLAVANGYGADVDRFINEASQDQLDELHAMDLILPFGDEKVCWVLATIGATLINQLSALLRAHGGGIQETVQPEELIPWMNSKASARENMLSPNQMAAAFAMAAGTTGPGENNNGTR